MKQGMPLETGIGASNNEQTTQGPTNPEDKRATLWGPVNAEVRPGRMI